MRQERRRLAGRYELEEVIGRGGMGTVYRARDVVLDRSVAVKVLMAELAEPGSSHAARFEREARAAAALTHPAVVSVYDTGVAEDATRYIVMEHVVGRSLAQILREQAPLEPARAVSIAERIAAALGAAHAGGIVHRDIKPGNVMVADDGSVKVLDFGIAHAADGTALTQTTAVLGSAAYMAPEQALGERVDARTDIYALGCLLYALLAGRPPFAGEAPAALLHQQVNSCPRPPSRFNGRVGADLDALVLRMLAKPARARPQSAEEVREALRRLTPGEPADTRPTARVPAAQPAHATARTRALRARARRRARRPGAAGALAGLMLLMALLIVLGLAVGLPRRGRAPAPAPGARRTRAARPAGSRAPRTAVRARRAVAPGVASEVPIAPPAPPPVASAAPPGKAHGRGAPGHGPPAPGQEGRAHGKAKHGRADGG